MEAKGILYKALLFFLAFIRIYPQEISMYRTALPLIPELEAKIAAFVISTKLKDKNSDFSFVKAIRPFLCICKYYYNNMSLVWYLYKEIFKSGHRLDEFWNQTLFLSELNTKGARKIFAQKLAQQSFLKQAICYNNIILKKATEHFYLKSIGFMIQCGFIFDEQRTFDNKPLLFSFLMRNDYDKHDRRSLQLLLKLGINPNQTDDTKKTPLMVACSAFNSSGHRKNIARIYIKTLLEAGADPLAVDAYGRAALDYVHGTDNKFEVSSILERYRQTKKNLHTMHVTKLFQIT